MSFLPETLSSARIADPRNSPGVLPLFTASARHLVRSRSRCVLQYLQYFNVYVQMVGWLVGDVVESIFFVCW